jgi:hypothetical protein
MLRIQLNQPKPTTFEQRLAQEAHRVKERAKTRRVRSANFYPSRLGNSRLFRTSPSGCRLPDSSHRGRTHVPGGASGPKQFDRRQITEFTARPS